MANINLIRAYEKHAPKITIKFRDIYTGMKHSKEILESDFYYKFQKVFYLDIDGKTYVPKGYGYSYYEDIFGGGSVYYGKLDEGSYYRDHEGYFHKKGYGFVWDYNWANTGFWNYGRIEDIEKKNSVQYIDFDGDAVFTEKPDPLSLSDFINLFNPEQMISLGTSDLDTYLIIDEKSISANSAHKAYMEYYAEYDSLVKKESVHKLVKKLTELNYELHKQMFVDMEEKFHIEDSKNHYDVVSHTGETNQLYNVDPHSKLDLTSLIAGIGDDHSPDLRVSNFFDIEEVNEADSANNVSHPLAGRLPLAPPAYDGTESSIWDDLPPPYEHPPVYRETLYAENDLPPVYSETEARLFGEDATTIHYDLAFQSPVQRFQNLLDQAGITEEEEYQEIMTMFQNGNLQEQAEYFRVIRENLARAQEEQVEEGSISTRPLEAASSEQQFRDLLNQAGITEEEEYQEIMTMFQNGNSQEQVEYFRVIRENLARAQEEQAEEPHIPRQIMEDQPIESEEVDTTPPLYFENTDDTLLEEVSSFLSDEEIDEASNLLTYIDPEEIAADTGAIIENVSSIGTLISEIFGAAIVTV